MIQTSLMLLLSAVDPVQGAAHLSAQGACDSKLFGRNSLELCGNVVTMNFGDTCSVSYSLKSLNESGKLVQQLSPWFLASNCPRSVFAPIGSDLLSSSSNGRMDCATRNGEIAGTTASFEAGFCNGVGQIVRALGMLDVPTLAFLAEEGQCTDNGQIVGRVSYLNDEFMFKECPDQRSIRVSKQDGSCSVSHFGLHSDVFGRHDDSLFILLTMSYQLRGNDCVAIPKKSSASPVTLETRVERLPSGQAMLVCFGTDGLFGTLQGLAKNTKKKDQQKLCDSIYTKLAYYI